MKMDAQPQTRTRTHTLEKKTTKKTWCHTKTPTQLPQNSMSTNNEFQKEILPRSLEPQTSPGGEDVLIIRCCVCGLTTMLPRKRSRHSSSRMPKPGAARLTPHCQIVWPNLFFRWEQGGREGQLSVPSDLCHPGFHCDPAFLADSSQASSPFKYFQNAAGFFKPSPCLLRHCLPRRSLLSKSGYCGCDSGRMAQQFAGGGRK